MWHDSNADLAAQRFVLWASRLLEAKEGDASTAYGAALAAALQSLPNDSTAASSWAAGNGAVGEASSSMSDSSEHIGASHSSGNGSWATGSNGAGRGGSSGRHNRLPVSVLVHCEMDGPPVELLASRSLLQVGAARLCMCKRLSTAYVQLAFVTGCTHLPLFCGIVLRARPGSGLCHLAAWPILNPSLLVHQSRVTTDAVRSDIVTCFTYVL